MITCVFANVRVSDLDRAREWYGAIFGREPDANPMPGLLEWHVGDTAGLQTWTEPAHAGLSGATLTTDDIDAAAARLSAAGIEHAGPEQATSSRILPLTDPDGNRVVLIGL